MAESMIVHFATATHRDVEKWLDQRTTGRAGRWTFPADSDYLVLAYEYRDLRVEYDDEELAELSGLLGGVPASGLCLELRRTKGRAAHEAAAEVAKDLLLAFEGVVQDISGYEYWSHADLLSGNAYRAAAILWPVTESVAPLTQRDK